MNDYKKYSDIELVRLLKASDHAAYEEIYNRYFYIIYIHCIKKLNDPELSKDFVQDTFIKFWLKREVILAETNVPGYLYTLLKNLILDYFGHEQVKAKYVASIKAFTSAYAGSRTDSLVREKDIGAQIDKEIDALPEKMKEVFVLSRKAELSYKEIAEVLHTTENNISKQVNNALKKLKVRFGRT